MHKLMKETKEKMAAHAKNIHTLEVVCVSVFFALVLAPFLRKLLARLNFGAVAILIEILCCESGTGFDCECSTSFVSSRALFTCRTR